MTRTTFRKLLSISIVISTMAAYRCLFARNGLFELPPAQRILLILAIVILFNVSSVALRKIFVAKRLIRRGRYAEGAQAAAQFITELETRPWKRLLCKLAIEVYTSEPEVLGYMCIASAYRQEGNLEAALAAYQRAAQIDPLCPLAYVGLALVSSALGDGGLAENYLARSRELGFTGSIGDKIFMLGGNLTGQIALTVPVATS